MEKMEQLADKVEAEAVCLVDIMEARMPEPSEIRQQITRLGDALTEYEAEYNKV